VERRAVTGPSLLDTDLYKLTMGQAVLKKFPNARAKYIFVNRGSQEHPITGNLIDRIKEGVLNYGRAQLTDDEDLFLRETCPYLDRWYIDWLRQFQLNTRHVKITTDDYGQMKLTIEGPWAETIYWEVPLLAIITDHIMAANVVRPDVVRQSNQARDKAIRLEASGCKFADFGTRRRYSYPLQQLVVRSVKLSPAFIGTSNVHFAMKYKLKPIGTMAHEWVQGVSALVGLRYANRFAMEAWNDVYNGDLGIALTDTFGSNAFFRDFDGRLARMFDGVRHDSGNPFSFADQAIYHYERLRIDPKSKTIVFSDSLDVDKCVELQKAFGDKIKLSFGIGTHLTNDVPGTTPTNIVIKLVGIDGIPVVKLSDDMRKAIGDPKALDVALWTFGLE
jgi:nicotinate phosphoribosyltransferase